MIHSIWKNGPLDILVTTPPETIARTEELSPRAFDSVIGIVLLGTLHATLACGRRWLKAKHKAPSSASRQRTRRSAQPTWFPPPSQKLELKHSPAASPSSGAIAESA